MQFETTAAGISLLVAGEVSGNPNTVISGVGSVDDAREGDVVLAEDEAYFRKALKTRAACIICGLKASADLNGRTVVRVENPGEAFASVLELFKGEEALPDVGVGCGSVVERDVILGEGVRIAPNCYVGRGAALGDGCVLFPNVYIGEGVRVGRETRLHPGVTVYASCSIGDRAILHAGVVIGADGFGYRPGPKGLSKLPHAGTVVIGDDVEIGANSAVDRAKTGATVIGRGTKIDNLVHIAHNVRIGEHCVVVALSGVAGSAKIGSGVTLAAQSGVRDHVKIGDGVVVAARSGVINDIEAGLTVSGFPAREHKIDMRAQAAALRLPDILERLRALEREVKTLRKCGEEDGGDVQR